jgi:uroporphyrinogen-III synthase
VFDVVIFTSSIQLDHLLDVAAQLDLECDVLESLRTHTAIASVGPVMTASLEARQLPPDIVPNHPKMGSLVKAASEESHAAIALKRSATLRALGRPLI